MEAEVEEGKDEDIENEQFRLASESYRITP